VVQGEENALLRASKKGHTATVEMLLGKGADIHHKNKVLYHE